MPLGPTQADACATAIASILGVVDTASINKYKQVYETLYSHLLADIQIIVTVASVTGVTPGGGVSGPGAGTGVAT